MQKIISNCLCVDISSEGKGVIKNGKDIIFCDGIFPDEKADRDMTKIWSKAGKKDSLTQTMMTMMMILEYTGATVITSEAENRWIPVRTRSG